MPQVTILEGGKPKSFAGVDKLQIALSGGGTSLWVPKDTRLLTSLTANENGMYPPPEGYYGFDTAIVNVPPSQVAGIDPKTGQYILVGYKKVEGEDPGWATGSEGDGSEDDPWRLDPSDPWNPDTDGGYGWDPWEVPDGGDWEPPSDWPTTENELTQEELPSYIKITTPPTKTSYTEGEDIDLTGIVVTLYRNDGTVYGIADLADLTPLPKKAVGVQHMEYEIGIPTSFNQYHLSSTLKYSVGLHFREDHLWGYNYESKGHIEITASSMVKACLVCDVHSDHTDSIGIVIASTEPYTIEDDDGRQYAVVKESRNDITYYRSGLTSQAMYMKNDSSNLTPNFVTKDNENHNGQNALYEELAYQMISGGTSGSPKSVGGITVFWKRKDGTSLTDSFDITVSDSASGGGNFSGGGGEGIGGGGGGGGF